MAEDQIMFFNQLRDIQDTVIGTFWGNFEKYKNEKDILKDVTCDVIVMIMELLDGYGSERIKYNIINVKTGNTINQDIQMHDACVEFLEYTDNEL